MNNIDVFLFGYSGHALVVNDCLGNEQRPVGYFDKTRSSSNPLNIEYCGYEGDVDLSNYKEKGYFFPSVGDNTLRQKLRSLFIEYGLSELRVVHSAAFVSLSSKIGLSTMIGPKATINALANIGNGVIVNSGAIIEHECLVGDYSHIAPGATLLGNVTVGEGSFIGANSVVLEGVSIGNNVIIGAGSVLLTDVPDNEVWAGIPALKKKEIEQ